MRVRWQYGIKQNCFQTKLIYTWPFLNVLKTPQKHLGNVHFMWCDNLKWRYFTVCILYVFWTCIPQSIRWKRIKDIFKLTYKIQNLRWELDWLYPDDKKKLTWRKPYVLKTSKKIVSVVHQQIWDKQKNKYNLQSCVVLSDQIEPRTNSHNNLDIQIQFSIPNNKETTTTTTTNLMFHQNIFWLDREKPKYKKSLVCKFPRSNYTSNLISFCSFLLSNGLIKLVSI